MEEKSSFKPFIPAEKIVPEFTATSIVIGVILAVLFGGANAYLGLRVGMTVSASIPAAVISMGIIRVILHRESILENNMVQTIGSAGESVAAGAIFTLPAMFMWMKEWGQGAPSLIEIALIALCGGVLGVVRGLALFLEPVGQLLDRHGARADDAQRPLPAAGTLGGGAQGVKLLTRQFLSAAQVEVRHDGERRAQLLTGIKPRQKALRRGLLERDEPGHQP